jgi:hypothetical protein
MVSTALKKLSVIGKHFYMWGFYYVIGFLAFIVVSDVYLKWFS